MSFKNVAVIGSNGFIGGHLTEKLLAVPGIKLSLFGKSEQSVFGNELPYTKLDLTNNEQVKSCFFGIDFVYYLASETIPASTWENPVSEIEKNLIPFLNFMEVIARLSVKKVVFTSSAGTIYGPSVQKLTEDSFKNPFSPHGITKLTMEYFLNYFKVKFGLNYEVYRISNVYGPGQNTKKGLGIINTFLEKIISEHKIQIFGDGETVRNYLYVEDLAELLTFSLFSDLNKSDIFNAASNDTLTINDLVKILKMVVGEDFDVIYKETRQSDNPAIALDNTKVLNAHPGFKFTGIKEGVLKTYEMLNRR
jgi:UDP-glucose 4-epimerase